MAARRWRVEIRKGRIEESVIKRDEELAAERNEPWRATVAAHERAVDCFVHFESVCMECHGGHHESYNHSEVQGAVRAHVERWLEKDRHEVKDDSLKPKLRYRPRSFGALFWPADDHPELAEGFVDMPGGDLVVRGRLELSVSVNDKGWPSEVCSDFLAYRPDVRYTFPTCYGLGSADALGAIDAARAGEDVVDLYFVSVREGFTDAEYSKQLAEMGLPQTKGRFVIRWDPKKVEVPPVVVAASEGRQALEAFLRRVNFERTHETTLDSRGGSWVVRRVIH